MSVYTSISRTQAEEFLSLYDVGEFEAMTPIESGVENSNYFLTTDQQTFVLTIFETLSAKELPYFFAILSRAGHALPVPVPVIDKKGGVIQTLEGKPCALFPKIAGKHVSPTPQHCHEIGKFLGHFHETFYDFELARHNPRPLSWFKDVYHELYDILPAKDKALFEASLDLLSSRLWAIVEVLPHSTIHGDLFHDNALLKNDMLTAVLDFYSAFTGPMFYDVAVTANDWCRNSNNQLDPEKLKALLSAYQGVRPFTQEEKEYAYEIFYWAAFRFWVSRLEAWYQPKQGELILMKDPDEFADLLRFLRYHFTDIFKLACS